MQIEPRLPLAMLAIVRKLIILDLAAIDAPQLFALAAATLALGAVYWLIREQDRRRRERVRRPLRRRLTPAGS